MPTKCQTIHTREGRRKELECFDDIKTGTERLYQAEKIPSMFLEKRPFG